MGFRFMRRLRIAPGVSLNFGGSGMSLSLGPRGAKYTVGPRGSRVSVGVPGTGLYYTQRVGGPSASSAPAPRAATPWREDGGGTAVAAQPAVDSKLTLGFFQKLTTPPEERAFVEGLKRLHHDDPDGALAEFREAPHLADAAFLGGLMALKLDHPDEAATLLESAVAATPQLGALVGKYGVSADATVPITEEFAARIAPSPRGALLLLAEARQRQGRSADAILAVRRWLALDRNDPVARVSLAELLLDHGRGGRAALEEVAALGEGIANDGEPQAALLLYRARALRELGLADAARVVASEGLRKTAGRSDELLRALRYERGRCCEALGQAGRARADYERIYAEKSDYLDVRARLGLG